MPLKEEGEGPLPGRTSGVAGLLSLGLLFVFAALLALPLLGLRRPSPLLLALILLARIGVQVWGARREVRLRRPASWLIDVVLIGLLVWSGLGH